MQSYLRYLDFDDLIILTSILDNKPLKDIAKSLGITPPALSHRLRKYKAHIPNFEIKSVQKKGNGNKWQYSDSLTEGAKQFCSKAKLALETLKEVA